MRRDWCGPWRLDRDKQEWRREYRDGRTKRVLLPPQVTITAGPMFLNDTQRMDALAQAIAAPLRRALLIKMANRNPTALIGLR